MSKNLLNRQWLQLLSGVIATVGLVWLQLLYNYVQKSVKQNNDCNCCLCNCNCWSSAIVTYVKRLSRSRRSRSRRKRGGGREVKRFCRERAGGTKTVGSDLACRFGLGAFSILNAPRCNIYIYIQYIRSPVLLGRSSLCSNLVRRTHPVSKSGCRVRARPHVYGRKKKKECIHESNIFSHKRVNLEKRCVMVFIFKCFIFSINIGSLQLLGSLGPVYDVYWY
jgi:hypothetical protein